MEVEGARRKEVNYMAEMKHVCKFCHKRFPCGRSLGGHMRSHLITNPSDHDHTSKEKVNTAMEKKKDEAKGKQLGDQDPNQIKCCKECGKAFHSSKALSGHMKSHAVERQRQKEKENSLLQCDEAVKATKQQQQEEFDRESDNEGLEEAAKREIRPRRGNRRQRYMGATSATTTTNSSVSEIDQQEQENVAMCLIMLSRDVGPWGGVNYEVSDTNSVFLEHKKVSEDTGVTKGLKLFKWVGETSTTCKDLESEGLVADEIFSSGYKKLLEKIKCREGSGADFSSKSVLVQPVGGRKRKAKVEELESDKRSNFECTTCNKTFHSYQALGGHRASHKKAKGCSSSNPDGTHKGEIEQISDVSVRVHSDQAEGRSKKGVQVINKHECPICFKEFPSGQALGGHKRSHLSATTTATTALEVERSNATTLTTTTTTTTTSSSHEVRDFLDLNLPAPVEEEPNNSHHHHHQQLELGGFKPWWVESTHKHEQIAGLI